MKDQTIDDQNKLIELIQSQGWNSIALELKEYESGFAGYIMGAEIELTVEIDYQDDEDDQNPYRIKAGYFCTPTVPTSILKGLWLQPTKGTYKIVVISY